MCDTSLTVNAQPKPASAGEKHLNDCQHNHSGPDATKFHPKVSIRGVLYKPVPHLLSCEAVPQQPASATMSHNVTGAGNMVLYTTVTTLPRANDVSFPQKLSFAGVFENVRLDR